ncbi:hypothetical protein OG394_11435 [Kribbella sp. NBC_01245]|uniref:hypothetical protein n=1 Tax=Kribbella sp. NBC_01245 TaxID=2903578 RepID=UPI002E295235|nr:hypothetical protein [Kribbella sp. NBC_01245]
MTARSRRHRLRGGLLRAGLLPVLSLCRLSARYADTRPRPGYRRTPTGHRALLHPNRTTLNRRPRLSRLSRLNRRTNLTRLTRSRHARLTRPRHTGLSRPRHARLSSARHTGLRGPGLSGHLRRYARTRRPTCLTGRTRTSGTTRTHRRTGYRLNGLARLGWVDLAWGWGLCGRSLRWRTLRGHSVGNRCSRGSWWAGLDWSCEIPRSHSTRLRPRTALSLPARLNVPAKLRLYVRPRRSGLDWCTWPRRLGAQRHTGGWALSLRRYDLLRCNRRAWSNLLRAACHGRTRRRIRRPSTGSSRRRTGRRFSDMSRGTTG